MSCTSECASGESAQGKCRAQKVGLAAGCHFSADQVCVEIFVCLLKKQTKQQKQIQEHLLVYKYTWVCFFFSDFVVPITAYASFSGVPKSRNISRKCSGYSTQIKAACATFIKIQPAYSCRGQMLWGTCGYQTLIPSFDVFFKPCAGWRVAVETAREAEQWFAENSAWAGGK